METAELGNELKEFSDKFYDPAEDSFLLIDCLEKDLNEIKSLRPSFVVELGSGSGVVISTLAKVLNDCHFMATDINPFAANATLYTSKRNNVSVDVILTDLDQALNDRMRGLVDILIFNPPYVVTPSEEVGTRDIAAAWAGGINGREVMDRLFPKIPNLLSKNGRFYLLVLKENNPDEIIQIMNGMGLKCVNMETRKCGGETLSVLKIQQ